MNYPDLVKKGVLCKECRILNPNLKTKKKRVRIKMLGINKENVVVFNPPNHYFICDTCKSTSQDEVEKLAEFIVNA